MGGEVDVLRVTKAERSEGATERERASVTRVGGKRAMSKPRRKGITRVVETEEDGKGNKIAKKRWGRGAYITVKNARGTSAVYTSSTIDRLQREGGGWRCWCWRRLDTALFYLPLKLERVGEEKRPVDGGFRSRHGNANDGLNEALTNRSSPLVSRSLNRPVHRRTPPPLCVIGTSVAPDRPRVVAGIQRRPRSRSTTIEIIFRGFVSNQLYTPGPNYAACRASFSADFVRTDNRILYPGHWKS